MDPGPEPQLPVSAFAARRARVAADLDAPLVVATHPEALFANDVLHRFRPNSDYWYLTGHQEPGGILVLHPDGTTDMFLHPRDPHAEIWTGRRIGVDAATDAFDVDHSHHRDAFGTYARDHLDRAYTITDHDPWTHRRIRRHAQTAPGKPIVAEHRVRKDADEIRLLQRACDVSVEAQLAAQAHIRPDGSEHEVEAAILATYRAEGSTGPGYPPIVGAGDNAAILHYIDNQAPIEAGDLVLVDAGCEWGYYTADITRTYAADKADEDQAALHELVAQAHEAAVATVRPGARIAEVHEAAALVLSNGLVAMGILEGPPEEAWEERRVRAYFMHGTSHFLGLDVHDAGAYKDAEGKSRTLEEGMVITVEPGLYFNPDFAPCPAHLAGIGVRIEDDILVTADGRRNLTGALPIRL